MEALESDSWRTLRLRLCQRPGRSDTLGRMARTDAIVAVLMDAGRAMHINEIIAALEAGGRGGGKDSYGSAAATMQIMLGSRVRRVAHGRYQAL